MGTRDHELLSPALELHVLELPKLPAWTPDATVPPVVQWGWFFAAKTDAELERVAMGSPELRRAKEALERLSVEPAAQQIARERQEARENYERTMASMRAHGKAEMLLRLLAMKFGQFSDDFATRVQRASETDLDRWSERMLSAETVDDVFR